MSNIQLILLGVGGTLFVVLVGGALFLKFVLPKLFEKGITKFAEGMFEAKAGALKGAALKLAGVEDSQGPRAHFEEDEYYQEFMDEERSGGRWVDIKVTITPAEKTGEECEFTHWEPEELSLIPTPEDGKLSLETLEDTEIECFALRPGSDPEEDNKIAGAAEVLLTAYIPSSVKRVSVHYYTELLEPSIEL